MWKAVDCLWRVPPCACNMYCSPKGYDPLCCSTMPVSFVVSTLLRLMQSICQRPTQRLEVQFLGLAIGPWAPKFINISNTLIKGKGRPLLS
ncbi:hypothetical protein D5086_001111 [Populus alba]|uniref:Uncharacterized protein n=1 Tax=Populus alba TaxID=43335 RepID=A0ACC4CXX0_POPAL